MITSEIATVETASFDSGRLPNWRQARLSVQENLLAHHDNAGP
jgi:hypothetical protein